MVKTTRRVKRSKKQVHHGRRKTNRRRYTRRQRGGRKIPVCATSGFDFWGNSKGIAITYDTDSQMYTIGNESYKILLTRPRYEGALNIVREHFSQVLKDDEPVRLDQLQFNTFKQKYCIVFAPIGGKEQCGSITDFNPPSAAPVAPVAAASATDTDSNKILIKREGVQFGSISKPWTRNACEFPEDVGPFKKYVFTIQTTPPSVLVKYVMSSDAKTFCALAKCATDDGSRMNDFKIDYNLVSPSVIITLQAQNVESWNIKDDFEITYRKILMFYDSCEEPYTGSYDFYQEKNPLIATLFFTKPPETVYAPIVYQRVIQKLIKSCVDQIRLNNKLFRADEVTTIVTRLEDFKQRLQTQDLKALQQLDNEVNTYVRVEFQRLLVQAKKAKSLEDRMGSMCLSGQGNK